MKIGILINSFFAPGGEERVVSLMANEWAREYDVTIFTFETRAGENVRNGYYVADNVHIRIVDGPRMSSLRKFLYALDYHLGPLPRQINDFWRYPKTYIQKWVDDLNSDSFDILIAISAEQTILLGRVEPWIKSRTIAWEHSSYEGFFDKHTGYLKGREQEFAECAKNIDNIVVLNDDIAHKYKQFLGLSTAVISNPKSFSINQKADMDLKCFVSCGRLESEKRYEDMIKAFAICKARGSDWDLLLIGGGRLQEQLTEYANQQGVGDFVHITGYVEDVADRLLSASIFLLTSKWEGFPMVITEALEVGLPIIAYDIPAMLPLVTDGREGYLVKSGDVKMLSDRMYELSLNKREREQMSEAAKIKANDLTPQMINKKWKELFNEVNKNTYE